MAEYNYLRQAVANATANDDNRSTILRRLNTIAVSAKRRLRQRIASRREGRFSTNEGKAGAMIERHGKLVAAILGPMG